jgi:ATP-dependent protease HslVU peptidase subunit
MGDGQATQDSFVVKANVTKVRRIGDGVIGGFAGRAADGLSLLERLEVKLEEHPGQLQRAAVELAKDWRQDRVLRNLEALLLVADARTTLWLSGNGDVIEAPDGVMGGSEGRAVWGGGRYRERLQAQVQASGHLIEPNPIQQANPPTKPRPRTPTESPQKASAAGRTTPRRRRGR